jgi:hypothetical protein
LDIAELDAAGFDAAGFDASDFGAVSRELSDGCVVAG